MQRSKTIDTYICDECGTSKIVISVEELNQLEKEWHSGIRFDFCSDCKTKVSTQDRILEDEKALKLIDGLN